MSEFKITKGTFDHEKDSIMETLGMEKERMDEIMGKAQDYMRENSPNGKKSEFLEAILDSCETVTEIVAGTLTWNIIAKQLDMSAEMKVAKSQEFAESLKIRK